jgi:hypothetical protein
MTISSRTLRLLPLLLVFLAYPERAGADDTPLPENAVARVAGRNLTYDGFYQAAAQQKLPHLRDGRSGAMTIYRLMIEAEVVAQVCQRLGIVVTEQDITDLYEEHDKAVRDKSRGTQTLADLMRRNKKPMSEMRRDLAQQIRKRRIAAHPEYLGKALSTEQNRQVGEIETVMRDILNAAKIVYYTPTAMQPNPTAKPPSPRALVFVQADPKARVPGRVLDMEEYGKALVLGLPSDEVRAMLDQECKTGLMGSQGLNLTDAEFDREMAVQRDIWRIQGQMASQEAIGSVSFEDFMVARYRMTLDDMRRKRYWRGFFALLRAERQKISEDAIKKHWEERRESLYGPRILVTDISIQFRSDRDTFGTQSKKRSQRQALKLAHSIPRQLSTGVPFSEVVRQINAAKDPGFTANRRRLRPIDEDRLLWNRAFVMKDGDLSTPIETLDEIHVVRREKQIPAPTYGAVRPVVLEAMARDGAREWLKERLLDKSMVRYRWPLPIRGES